MKRLRYAMLTLCFAATAAACANDRAQNADRPAEARAGTPGAAGTSGTAAREPNRDAGLLDRNFVTDMMADGHAEVDLAKLARQKASNRQVKDFAAMMIRDHQRAAVELKTVAGYANIDMGKAVMDERKDVRDRLATLSGSEFDREYMKQMVDDHEKAVDAAEDTADGSGNDHVKQWAAKALPTLKKHLEQARQIRRELDKG